MKKLTLKQAFYKGVNGIFEQGKPSVNSDICLYNGPGGLHCAIGHIPPNPELLPEGMYIEDSPVEFEFKCQTGLEYQSVLNDLQRIHDDLGLYCDYEEDSFLEDFMERTAELAKENGLDYTGEDIS